jgi:hypothetical protein
MQKFASILLTAILAMATLPASAQEKEPWHDSTSKYKLVSEIIAGLPEFWPSLGHLYVDPTTLPTGPYFAYGHNSKLVSTIYMIPLTDLNSEAKFDTRVAGETKFNDLAVGTLKVDHVDVYFHSGHAGLNVPHVMVVLWHIPAADEASVKF